jgi:tetratricopeptide (TPR) repeat protein
MWCRGFERIARMAMLTVVASLPGIATPAVAQDDEDEPQLPKIVTPTEAFDCSRVGRLWQDASKKELTDAELHIRSTKLYFSQGLYEKAAREAEIAVHLDPADPDHYMRLAMAYGALTCYEAAGKTFDDALKLTAGVKKHQHKEEEIRTNRAHFWSERFIQGTEHFDRQEFEEAAAEFRNAIAVDSTDARAWSNLGVAHAKLEQNRPAMRAFETALALDPNDENTRLRYRAAMTALGVEEYNSSVAVKDDSLDVALERIQSAARHFENVLSQDPPSDERRDIENYLGVCWEQVGELQADRDAAKSAEAFNNAITHYRAAARVRAEIDAAQGGAMRDIREDPEYLNSVLVCLLRLGETDSTLVYGQDLIDLNPRSHEGYGFVANAYRAANQQAEALKYLLMQLALQRGKPVEDVSAHFVDLTSRYDPDSDIVDSTISEAVSPEEIRVNDEGNNVYEVWIYWAVGRAKCYVNGRDAGTITFKPSKTTE